MEIMISIFVCIACITLLATYVDKVVKNLDKAYKENITKIVEAYEENRKYQNINAELIRQTQQENKELMKKVWALELEVEKLKK